MTLKMVKTRGFIDLHGYNIYLQILVNPLVFVGLPVILTDDASQAADS